MRVCEGARNVIFLHVYTMSTIMQLTFVSFFVGAVVSVVFSTALHLFINLVHKTSLYIHIRFNLVSLQFLSLLDGVAHNLT